MDASSYVEPEPELPRRIGRYDALLQIGTGGMARVYLGVQHGPFAAKKLVAIKQVSEAIGRDKQYLEMFIDEARIALRMNHPNVVHTYEVLDAAPDYYLVMEFLDGQSLLEVLRRVGREKMPLNEHIWILSQLLAGLHYAHELRDFDDTPLMIVHRDVTPSNVFVCSCGGVKLLDFGIAKASVAVAATQTGMVKGKLGYVSPEQCLAQPASVRSDIYAVGVMLWEAIARQRRMSNETQAAQLLARIRGQEPPIEQVQAHVPPALAAMCRRALAVDPEQRYATARDFQRDIDRYLAEQPEEVGAESVSRLLRQHFTQERVTLSSVIDAHIGVYAQAVELEPTPSPTAREGSAEASLDDAHTLVASLDDRLLRASKPRFELGGIRHLAPVAALRACGAAFVTQLDALSVPVPSRSARRTAALVASSALVSAASLWLLTTPLTRIPRGDAREVLPAAERGAVEVRTGAAEPSVGVRRALTNEHPEPEPLVCLAHSAQPSAASLQHAPAPAVQAERDELGPTAAPAPARARPRVRVRHFSARSVEPGSDLWGTVRARRERSIDEENPYSP